MREILALVMERIPREDSIKADIRKAEEKVRKANEESGTLKNRLSEIEGETNALCTALYYLNPPYESDEAKVVRDRCKKVMDAMREFGDRQVSSAIDALEGRGW